MSLGLKIFLGSFLILWAVVVLLVCGDVMRESDQASLLLGAGKLAESFSFQQSFHNYSGQFGSYWLLSLLQKPFSFEELPSYVKFGNYCATCTFVFGLAIYAVNGFRTGVMTQRHGVIRTLLVVAALTTPTVILSTPLLASNVFAGGFLLILVGCSCWWSNNRNLFGIMSGAGIVFFTVCLRRDAAFLLPVICLMPLERLSFKDLLGKRYFWAFLATSVLAVILGAVATPESYFPAFVTDWKLIGCYSFLGLLGGGLVLVWSALISKGCSVGKFSVVVCCIAVFLPFLMYVTVLYSPRHLFIAGLVPLVIASSSWLGGEEGCFRKVDLILYLGVALNAGWLLVAPKFQENFTVKLGVKNATCYPTADGLWPMGGGVDFLKRLSSAQQINKAVDHNQEIWNTWVTMDQRVLAEEFSIEATLNSYGKIWAWYHGGKVSDNPKYILQTDREWIDARQRWYNGKSKDWFEIGADYTIDNLYQATSGRCVFTFPRIRQVKPTAKEEQYHSQRKELHELYPSVEFILCEKVDERDGYIYKEFGENIYRSNYPKIILKYFNK